MEGAVRDEQSARRAPRVLFFGMQGSFSQPSLLALLERGVDVCAVIVPAAPRLKKELPSIRRLQPPPGRSLLPLAHSFPSILHIAAKHMIPIWEVAHLKHAQTLATLYEYEPDILCVACFSLLIPPSILAVPKLGSLNVHPGLLPANRGPVPLFWTFREGDEYAGVTIHLMEEKMDRGPLLAQERFIVPDGIRYEQLEAQCAQLGGQLLAHSVWELFEGRAQPHPQDEAKSSYHTFPTEADLLVLSQEWNARHLFNFIRAVSTWNGPVELRSNDTQLLVRDAISYILGEPDQKRSLSGVDSELDVPCKDGSVRVLLDEK